MSEPSDLFLPKDFVEKTKADIAGLKKAQESTDKLLDDQEEIDLELRREIAKNRLIVFALSIQLQLAPHLQPTSPLLSIATQASEDMKISSNRLDVELKTSEEPLEDVAKWTKEARQYLADRGL